MYQLRFLRICSGIIHLFSLRLLDVPSEIRKKEELFVSSSSSSLEGAAAGVAGENRQVRVPDVHSTRGKVSRVLISSPASSFSETSEQTDKFLHCGAGRAG